MDTTLRFELKIIRARNVDGLLLLNKNRQQNLFVRCYLPTENHNRSVEVNSKEIMRSNISSDGDDDLFWDDSFSLECSGNKEGMDSLLRKGNVVFELRCRRKKSILERISSSSSSSSSSSELLGRGEIPWKSVLDSPEMENKTWVPMISNKNPTTTRRGRRRRSVVINDDEDLINNNNNNKSAEVQVSMKIVQKNNRVHEDRLRGWKEECGCMDCKINGYHSFADFDVFAFGFALEGC